MHASAPLSALLPADEELAQTLRDLRPHVAAIIDDVLSDFYATLSRTPQLYALFGGGDGMEKARAAQRRHWLDVLMTGAWKLHAEQVRRIGHAHVVRGVTPTIFCASYAQILSGIAGRLARNKELSRKKLRRGLDALVRVAYIDMIAILDLYLLEERESARDAIRLRAEDFEKTVLCVAEDIDDAGRALVDSAETLSSGTADLDVRLNGLADTASRTAEAMGSVTGATGEIASAMEEVARRNTEAATISRTAADKTSALGSIFAELNEATQGIAEATRLIEGIARQTQLLSLNAAIEAARAGALGSGFAVVAGEVKGLAQETAVGTEKVDNRVARVRAAVERASAALADLTATTDALDTITEQVASAVHQQQAAHADISRTIATVAESMETVRRTAEDVRGLSRSTEASVAAMHDTSGALRQRISGLKTNADTFLSGVLEAAR